MSRRTYLPTLLKTTRYICKYIGEHQEVINEFIGEEHANKVSAVLLACQTLVAALEIVIVEGT